MPAVTPRRTQPAEAEDMDRLTAKGTGAAGLATAAARWTLCFAWLMGVASGLLSGIVTPDNPSLALGYLMALVGAVVLTSPGDTPLSGSLASVVVVCCLTVAVIVLADNPTGAVYLFDYASFLVALLVPRGNRWHGAVGGAVMIVGAVAWGLATGALVSTITGLVSLAVMAQVLGVVWRLVLRRTVRLTRWHRSAAAADQRAIIAAEKATRLLESELAEVRTVAEPVLRRIAEGHPMTEELAREVAMTEGQIRDRLRAPTFRHPALIDAIATLRSRGTDVTVVSPPHIERIGDAAAAQIIGSLLGSTAQRVVLRAAHVDNAVHVTLRQDGLVHTIHAGDLEGHLLPQDRNLERDSS